MSQISTRCPACHQSVPVRAQDLEKDIRCQHCQKQFHLERLHEYVLIDVLGQGAFGIVHRAYDLRNPREVALKQLNEKAVPEHEFDSWIQRAVTEARALAKIDFHPNVLPLYTSGRVGKRFFMVTPIIRGDTLDKIIPDGGFPDPLRAVQLAITILRALQHVHGFKVYHRDVKPSNIMIDANGNLFLVDFGLASCRQIDTALHTEMGTVLGTPAYMPPEQARGEVNRIGPWSDQYGAGAVLFKMLTGNVPYSGKGYAVLADVGNYDKPPKRPREFRPNLDPDLEKLVLRSLEKYPGKRFGSCAEFAEALRAWGKKRKGGPRPPPPEPDPVPPTPEPDRTVRPARRSRKWFWTAAIIIAAVVLVAGGCLVWMIVNAANQPPSPKIFDPLH